MSKVRARGERICRHILANVERYPHDIVRNTAEHFDISRQAVHRHVRRLIDEGALVSSGGSTRNRSYRLRPLRQWRKSYALDGLAEDVVWRSDVLPEFDRLPENVRDIWHYGFTEMFNNAIDHSQGSSVGIDLTQTAATTEIALFDDGVGIFRKIQRELGLLDERHAVLELAKGKLTTDPRRHTGEGIFFASRMFDDFEILSGGTYFSHKFDEPEDWILERYRSVTGTTVWMKLDNHAARTIARVFDEFTSGDDFGFTRTVVPVRLAQYGDDKLMSRSQAKRLLARIDRFRTVIFDFEGVDSVGQAFADEIFRVFTSEHPEMECIPHDANPAVQQMIARARSAGAGDT